MLAVLLVDAWALVCHEPLAIVPGFPLSGRICSGARIDDGARACSAVRSAVARRPSGPARRSSAVGASEEWGDDLADLAEEAEGIAEGIEGVEDAGPETVAVRNP